MTNMMKTYVEYYLSPYVKNEEGQGMAEYGLILALVAVVAIAGLILLGPSLSAMFVKVDTKLQ